MIGQQKNYRILYHPNHHVIEKNCNHFLKPRWYQNYLGIFWEIQMSRYYFYFTRAPDMFLRSSHIYKQLDDMRIFSFCLVCFTFSISYSEFPFHLILFSNFSISSFFYVLSQAFIKNSKKAFVYLYIKYVYNV